MGFSLKMGAAVALSAAFAANAALIDRGNGMIYDSTLNVTWLADMNYARTSGYDADGLMRWTAANNWANNLIYGGYSDWRLPTMNIADATCNQVNAGGFRYGTACIGSELNHLFRVDLGNKPNESVFTQTGDTATQIANLALFRNVQNWGYHSVTAANGTDRYLYGANSAYTGWDLVDLSEFYAVAVRTGDVPSAIPEPQSLALVLLALAAVAYARRPIRH